MLMNQKAIKRNYTSRSSEFKDLNDYVIRINKDDLQNLQLELISSVDKRVGNENI